MEKGYGHLVLTEPVSIEICNIKVHKNGNYLFYDNGTKILDSHTSNQKLYYQFMYLNSYKYEKFN